MSEGKSYIRFIASLGNNVVAEDNVSPPKDHDVRRVVNLFEQREKLDKM